MRNSLHLMRVIALVLGVIVPSALAASDKASSLASIERRVQAVYEKVAPAVVRIGDRESPSHSGVIVTPDGHVITTSGHGRFRRSDLFALHLADGRRVAATALGWSEEWGVALVKMKEKGPWPHVRLDETADVKAGQHCVVLGYPSQACDHFDRWPALRLSCVTRSAAPIWLTSSCSLSLSSWEDLGGGVFDLNGRLLGVTTRNRPGGHDPVHTPTELIRTLWADLVAGKNLDHVRLHPSETRAGEPSGTAGEKPQSTTESERLSAAIEKGKAATVLFRRSGEQKGCSGVIVTSDGYVATCAHHFYLPGEKVTIRLPDGREAAGRVLGTNWVRDTCLVKITEKGPWPYVEMGNSAMMRPDAPCLVMGYPYMRQDKPPLVRTTQIVEPENHRWSWRLHTPSSCRMYGGDSGGGVFDLDGRLVALNNGSHSSGRPNSHGRVEVFRKQWDFLAAAKPVELMAGEPLSEIKAAFEVVAKEFTPVVVEVLGDEQQRALGTIVRSDGRILTKASELYGALSCRFADGRTLPATVETVSRDHDLAVLKVDARNLPEAEFSRSNEIRPGKLVAAPVPGKPPLAGAVSHAVRPIPREYGHLPIGEVGDSERGLEVLDDSFARKASIPLRKGDIIVHVEGRPTPDVESYLKLVDPEIGIHVVHAGDPIRVGVKRDDKTLEFRFPLPLGRYMDPRRESLRRSAFPSVFDATVPLTPNQCGGPVTDKTGRVAGIAIACRNGEQIYVVPAAVAGGVLAD